MAESTAVAPRSEYYVDAFRSELERIWGHHPRFAGEIHDLAHARALACSVKRTRKNVELSRRLLFHYLSEFKGDNERSLINVMYKQLPVENFAEKFLNNVCTLYKWAPKRQFGEKGRQNALFEPIYTRARVNRFFRRAHRLVRMVGTVAGRWVVRNGEISIELMTRDLFCVVRHPDNPLDAREVWYPIAREVDGREVVFLRRMTDAVIEDYDPTDLRTPRYREDNTWGEIHWVFLRLEDDAFYGEGDHDLLELRMESNGQRFYANLSAKYESHGVGLGINLEENDEDAGGDDELFLPPGSVITRNGVGADQDEDPPSFQWINPAGQYSEIDELRRNRKRDALRDRGVPNANLVENPGQVASGRARQIEREELNDVREQDAEALTLFEQRMKRKLAVCLEDAPVTIDGKTYSGLPADEILTVEFQREPLQMEPKDQLEHMKTLVDADILPITKLLWEFGDQPDSLDDDEAVEIFRKNRELRKRAAADSDDEAVNPPAPPVPPSPPGEPSEGTDGAPGSEGSGEGPNAPPAPPGAATDAE